MSPRVFVLNSAREFQALFPEDGAVVSSDCDEETHVTIYLSPDLLVDSHRAQEFMHVLSEVLSFGTCPRRMRLTLKATQEFLRISKSRQLSLDMTALTKNALDAPPNYPADFTLDLTETALDHRTAIAFANFISGRLYSTNFSLILSNNLLGLHGLTALANALSEGEGGPYGLRLVLKNTMDGDRMAQISVAMSFANVFLNGRFPIGLFLNLNLGWDRTFPALRAQELIQAAIGSQSSSTLARLMFNGVITGDSAVDENLEQRISESRKFADIFRKLSDEKMRILSKPRCDDDSGMFKSFYDEPPAAAKGPFTHMYSRLVANQQRYDEGTLQLELARRRFFLGRVHEILSGYTFVQYQFEYDQIELRKRADYYCIVEQQEVKKEIATWEDLKGHESSGAIRQPPQRFVSPVSIPQMPRIPGVPALTQTSLSAQWNLPGIPRMINLTTGALDRLRSYRPWESP